MQYSFGTGVLFGRKAVTSGVATPIRFGGVQGVSVDFAFTTKELYGQKQFPIAIGRGTAKITGKANFAQLNGLAFNDLFFGEAGAVAGSVVTVSGEEKTVTANVATATNNTTFLQDLGVVLDSDGSIFTKAASAPGLMQYSCNETTGVYTFNSAQNAAVVQLSYQYTDAANGKNITINNQLLGTAPTFQIILSETFNGKKLNLDLYACISSQLSLATKLEDFTIPDFSFQCFAAANEVIGKLSVDE